MTRKKADNRIVFGLAMAMAFHVAFAAPIKKVLLFTKVGYFEHVGGIKGCTAALDTLASRYGFTVKVSKEYKDLVILGTDPTAYDIVIFDNNTDAGGVTNTENAGQEALKDWLMNKGGRYLGIHSASDHRGEWAWYDTVLYSGIRFAQFGDGQFSVYRDTSEATRDNPALQSMYRYAEDSLGLATAEVKFNSEYYHFKDSKTNANVDPRTRSGFTSFQELRGNNAVPIGRQSIGWVKPLPNGGRFLYTSLGHETREWTDNRSWLAKMTWVYMKYLMGDFDHIATAITPRIQAQGLSLRVLNPDARLVRIIDITGRVVASGSAADFGKTLAKAGIYFVLVDLEKGKTFSQTVILN